ncbi:MAG: methyl-accepting chemotaxis protein [Gracilibacteraceae bacterium]|jgi:methyl-accepting chemotaxis protein|nr:methyl-accepting chemotaxis protein [Gracilibacteraceae bacterium]
MKNLKIGAKIFVSFALVLLFLLGIAATSAVSTMRTRANISEVEVYSGLQNSANDLMHILNETRITAGVLYKTADAGAYADIAKQLMYCDVRLDKLLDYIGANPEIAGFRADILDFQTLYDQWCTAVRRMDSEFPLAAGLDPEQTDAFAQLAAEAKRLNLLAHEKLSNTMQTVTGATTRTMAQTQSFITTGLYIVLIVSAASLAAALFLAIRLRRSLTLPMGHMCDVLTRIGRAGDMQLPEQTRTELAHVAAGKDETAQCAEALLALVERLRRVDRALALVAAGDLTVEMDLQSRQDTMGLAVRKMVENLGHKFDAIARAIDQVHKLASEVDEGSRLLASGSESQAESMAALGDSVGAIEQKTGKNAEFADQATGLANSIHDNARTGTEKMGEMTRASAEINEASQAISKVIKTIDDIAFQTNLLALNASVEAARAGAHGKGFAVVAEEVRNLAAKSAQAAQETSALIENTIQKAALGSSIAKSTSQALHMIAEGVAQSSVVIRDISASSKEQSADMQQISANVAQVESIVEQNSRISAQAARASGEIFNQLNLLKELVAQFKLRSA